MGWLETELGLVALAAMLSPTTPSFSVLAKTWVAVVDVVAGLLLLAYVVRATRRPADPERTASMIARMNVVASSPAIAIVAASSRSPSRRSPNWTRAPPSPPSPGSRSRSCRCCRSWPRS